VATGDWSFDVAGRPLEDGKHHGAPDWFTVTPGYFEALRVRLVRGRLPGAEDGPLATPVIFMNETAARTFFAGQDPLGQRMRLTSTTGPTQPWRQVAGVVSDVRHRTLERPPRPEIYVLLPPTFGWRPEAITEDLDLVVLGMHARKDNPELLRARELGLKVQSFPEFIYHIANDKTRVVVAGSHGKTTTSGMIAHVLNSAGVQADRMIGASIGDLDPVTLTDAPVIILEGDEYLSSPEDPRPKFLHYHPHITVITGIAWDHMNVFPTYQSYIDPFRQLISAQKAGDTLVYCTDDPDLDELVRKINPPSTNIPYTVFPYQIEDGTVSIKNDKGEEYPLQIFGIHNLQNLSAACHVCHALGVPDEEIFKAMSSFKGASKRLQKLHKGPLVTAYLDFAHAPSKVKATVRAVREKHKEAHIIAILELHTFSSLNPDFLPQYQNALESADEKIVYYSPHTLSIKKLPPLSREQLSGFFHEEKLVITTSAAELESAVRAAKSNRNTVLLWMSSGRFDGLDIQKLSESFEESIH
jgi:UDP-N-acetylmuramate: L-alanyl-gamma-D-glutamyl-meso-diaminopimelate ligase